MDKNLFSNNSTLAIFGQMRSKNSVSGVIVVYLRCIYSRKFSFAKTSYERSPNTGMGAGASIFLRINASISAHST